MYRTLMDWVKYNILGVLLSRLLLLSFSILLHSPLSLAQQPVEKEFFATLFSIDELSINDNGITAPQAEHINLGDKLLYLEDSSHNLTVADILLHNSQLKWRTNNSTVPNFGYSQSVYWFKLTLENNSDITASRLLEVEYPLIDYLDLTIIHAAGRTANGAEGHTLESSSQAMVESYKTGTALPFSSRPIKHRNFLFPVEMTAHATAELLFRVESDQAIQLPVKLWTNLRLLEVDESVLLIHGLYFGLMAVMALYNLFIFLFTKDPSYLFYVCFVVSIALFQATQQGLSFQYIWPASTVWHANSTAILIATTILFSMLFVDQFLELNRTDLSSHYFTTVIAVAATLLVIATVFVPATAIMQMGILLAIPTCIGALTIGIRSWFRGHHQARYYIIAWAIFLLGTVALSLNKFGWLPRSFVTEYSSQIGSGLEVILLAIALADRINQQRRATELAQERALVNEMFARELEEKAKERLERNVAERTRELSLALKKLSHANKALESLSTTDGLTQVKNRRFFNLTIVEEWKRATRGNYPLSLLLIDLDHFKQINDRYGHMVGDECLIQTAAVIESKSRRIEDSVCRYGGEEFAVILPNIDTPTAMRIAEKIRQAIYEIAYDRDGSHFNLSASIGISTIIPSPSTSINGLITQADNALYKAKEAGRNCSIIFSSDSSNITPIHRQTSQNGSQHAPQHSSQQTLAKNTSQNAPRKINSTRSEGD